ncbi:hypothetical protein N431DRAFT_328915 [Stipitochalara longipes BDJ]|nr:hypothetical protein N431DRAFT_328915 [Stipitochalara longipes BDJ]
MSPKATNPFNFDPDGDLVLVLSRPSNTKKAASEKAAKGSARPLNNKRKRGSSAPSAPAVELEKVNMIVSSKHMVLASPVFKAMLAPESFREGLERNTTGQMEVELPDDDEVVMVVALNIIHGRNRLVPKHVDLDMLAKLAILVDKYQMVEAVFKRQDEFKKITQAAIICFSAKLADEVGIELPIPEKVIESITKKRKTSVSKLLDIVKEPLEKYQGSDVVCSAKHHRSSCDATILGSLIKSMVSYIIWPIPEPPYEAFTFSGLSAIIDGLRVTSFCQKTNWDGEKGHGIRKSFQEKVIAIESKLAGLDIKTFKE